MKKIKNIDNCNKLYLLKIGAGFLFFFFINYCQAQNARALAFRGNETFNLSGIYSSKKPSDFSERSRIDSTDLLPSDFPINNPYYKEEIGKRTFTSRTFKDGKEGVIIQYSSKNLNYLDKENKFQPINAKLESSQPSTVQTEREDGAKKDKGGVMFAWAALQQQYPTYLYKDGSTALSSDKKNKIIFNQNGKINEAEMDISDYTVGEEGMFINNVIKGIDKKIIFYENAIETDYIIRQPINTGNHDLVISEEIELPTGYYLSPIAPSPSERGLRGEALVVYSSEGIENARFKAPVFYDADKEIEFGRYNLIQDAGKNILQIIIPKKWLNDVNRSYPITIDPVVTGPTSNYPAIYMNSCVLPNYASDSMLVTIPGGITITKFIVEDSYFADALSSPPALMEYGHMMLSTVCGAVNFSCQSTDTSGTCYLVPNTDLKTQLACCFSPSCTAQTFYLTHSLARNNYGPGCNQDYIFYSPVWPVINGVAVNTTFSAYIVGKTVETAQVQWSVSPTTLCSDSCTIFLDVATNFGVPPYTITHPWATGPSQYGAAVGSCSSTGTHTITLTIPNCPNTCGTNPTLSIPPPVIKDVCGDSVTGLTAKTITINPVPVATAPSGSICSGSPLNIPVSSCVAGSTYQWTGSDGSSGTGNISDTLFNTGPTLITINYSVTPSANGCIGQPITVSTEVDTLPIINGGLNDTVELGVSTQLNVTGGMNYLWTPSSGLSCTDCSDPIAAPVLTTSYVVSGNNEYGCSSSDTINIFVTQGSEVLYIPNSFSPNENNLNDLFYVYGTSIRTIDIQIFDRWGELVFRTHDIKQGWDGKIRGGKAEGGVYVYAVSCEWLSGTKTYRNGIVTVLR